MKKSNLLSAVCAVLFSLIAMSANATLHGRLPLTPDGTDYQAAYDDVLGITWVTNGALSTKVSWQPQVDWAANLDYLGFDDWRLASMAVSAGLPTGAAPSVVSCNSATELACRDNEMGYMFYQNMGGTIGDTLTGNQTVDGVLLSNVQGGYWSGTEYATDPAGAWFFTFIAYPGGHYGVDIRKGSGFSGWAVRDGDVSSLPILVALVIDTHEGTPQECTATGGSNVTMVGNVIVDDPNEIVEITWYLDEDSIPVASGDTVEFFVTLGPHSVTAVVDTVTLGSASDTTSITIGDTTAPQIDPVFLDSKTGAVITSISHKGNVEIFEGVVDTCDSAPTITSAVGLPTQEGDMLDIKGNKKDASISVTSGPNRDTVTLTVIAEDASGNMSSNSATLTVTP
jgi:hypothetical protein